MEQRVVKTPQRKNSRPPRSPAPGGDVVQQSGPGSFSLEQNQEFPSSSPIPVHIQTSATRLPVQHSGSGYFSLQGNGHNVASTSQDDPTRSKSPCWQIQTTQSIQSPQVSQQVPPTSTPFILSRGSRSPSSSTGCLATTLKDPSTNFSNETMPARPREHSYSSLQNEVTGLRKRQDQQLELFRCQMRRNKVYLSQISSLQADNKNLKEQIEGLKTRVSSLENEIFQNKRRRQESSPKREVSFDPNSFLNMLMAEEEKNRIRMIPTPGYKKPNSERLDAASG